jgi:MFS family permease
VTEESTETPAFPGWKVVAACFVLLTTSAGLGFYGLAVYLNTFSRELDWQVSSVSLATTVFFLVSGIAGVFVAQLIERVDARIVVCIGALIGAVSLSLFGQITQQWQLYVVYIVYAIGWSAAGLVTASTIVTRWFQTRRAVALSVASTGLSAGGIIITPIAKWLLDEQGLSGAAPWLAGLWLLGVVPLTLLWLKPDPARLGWHPDGVRVKSGCPSPTVHGAPYSEAVITRFFVVVTIGYVMILGSQVGAIQQLVKLVEERTDRGTATLATTVLAATSVVARLLGGRLVEKVGTLRLAFVLAGLQSLGMLVLAFAESVVVTFAGIIVLGATIGTILILQPLLISERFGVRDYPRIFSRTQLYTTFGTAGGPLLLGWLRDTAGGYRTSYVVAAILSLSGAIVLSSSGPTTVSSS